MFGKQMLQLSPVKSNPAMSSLFVQLIFRHSMYLTGPPWQLIVTQPKNSMKTKKKDKEEKKTKTNTIQIYKQMWWHFLETSLLLKNLINCSTRGYRWKIKNMKGRFLQQNLDYNWTKVNYTVGAIVLQKMYCRKPSRITLWNWSCKYIHT